MKQKMFRPVSILIIISFLWQDVILAIPVHSSRTNTLNVNSAFDLDPRNSSWLDELRREYTGRILTDADKRRIREVLAKVTDPRIRRTACEILGLNIADIEIPEGSKIVKKGNKTLYIPPSVIEKMKEMDRFVAEREFVAEIAGYGLTRKISENTSVVIDFILPRFDRIFTVEGVSVEQRVSNLMSALANSRRLTLSLEKGRIVLVSNNSKYSIEIDDFGWGIVRKYIDKLLPQDCPTKNLPENPEELKALLWDKGEIYLDTDWDLVVAGSSAWVTDNYIGNVHIEAMRQGAKPDFTMHHHPHLGFAITIFNDKPIEERQRYYKELLKFSTGDLQYMKQNEVEWFEIRAIGTPEDLWSRAETTSRFYNMEEIEKLIEPVREVVRELIDMPLENAGPERLFNLIQRLLPLLERFKEADFNADTILRYIIGDEEYSQLKERTRLPKDIYSLKDFVLHFIFREDPLKSFKEISLGVLKVHVQNGTFEIFKQIMKVYRSKPRSKKRVNDFLSRNKLWDITLETDPVKTKQGTELIKRFLYGKVRLRELDLSKIPDNPGMEGIDIKSIIREVVEMLLQNPELKREIEAIYVFGSVAKGTANDSSDIDLFVRFKDLPKVERRFTPRDEAFYERIKILDEQVERIRRECQDKYDISLDIYHNAIPHPKIDRKAEIDWDIAGRFEGDIGSQKDKILIWKAKSKKPSSEITVDAGAIKEDEALEKDILKIIENIEVAEWKVELVDGEVKNVKPINLYLPVQKQVQDEIIALIKRRLENAFRRLMAVKNYLPEINKGRQEFTVVFHKETVEGKERKLGRLSKYLPHEKQELVELHPLALLSDRLLLYGLRHELDHALEAYPENVELDLSFEEERAVMNDRAFFSGLSLEEQEELLSHLDPKNPNGVDIGGKVYKKLYKIYSDLQQGQHKEFIFQPEEPTRVHYRSNKYAYRFIDSDHPIDMVLGDQLIKIIKSNGELIFLVSFLYDTTKPTVEFKITTDTSINIGRHKKTRGIVRGKSGREIERVEVENDIDLPQFNSTVSGRHLKLTIDNIRGKITKITLEDPTSLNGTMLYQSGKLPKPERITSQITPVKKQSVFDEKDSQMNIFIKGLNFEIDLNKDGWEDRLRAVFHEKRDELAQGLTGDIINRFLEKYSDRFLEIWIENLMVFKEYVLFLRQMNVNLVIRRENPIDDSFRKLVERQVKTLRRLPIGLLTKCREFFPFVISETQKEMPEMALGAKRIGDVRGTVIIRNDRFRSSGVFSKVSLGSLPRDSGEITVSPSIGVSDEDVSAREEMSVSPETICAHEFYHHLHLEEGALLVRDFIEMLKTAEKRFWFHKSMLSTGKTIRGNLPDVIRIMEDALAQGEKEGKEAMMTVCKEYSMIHTTFYTPAEVVSFCLSHDIGAEKELGPVKFNRIRQVGQKNMLRSVMPIARRVIEGRGDISIYEIYVFKKNKHRVCYGDSSGNILIAENGAIRNDRLELGERDKEALTEAIRIKLTDIVLKDRALIAGLKHYMDTLMKILEDPVIAERKLFFIDDIENLIGPIEDHDSIQKIHQLINDAIYTAGYQISFKDRYEILRKIFNDYNPPADTVSRPPVVGRLLPQGLISFILYCFIIIISACGGGDAISPYITSDAGTEEDRDVPAMQEQDAGRQDAGQQDSGEEDPRPAIDVYPGDSIQAAIDSASEGYVIHIHPGEYPLENEPIPSGASAPRLILKPGVCLVSVGGPEVTTIRGVSGAYMPAVIGASNATLEGFTITGSSALSLDGVYGMTAKNNHLIGYQPLLIESTSSENVIEGNKIQMVELGPGAVSVNGDNNVFRGNNITGAAFVRGSNNNFERNIMTLDNNTSLTQYAWVLQIRTGGNNIFNFNTIYVPEFGYRPDDFQYTNPLIEVAWGSTGNRFTNGIIAAWTPDPELQRIWVQDDPDDPSSITFEYTLIDSREGIEGPAAFGEGVIYGDPLFVDPNNNDYNLQSDSPAINAGDPGEPADPDGTRPDLGAIPYDHRMGVITPKDVGVKYAGIAVPIVTSGYARSGSKRRRYIGRFLTAVVLALALFGSKIALADNPHPSRPPVTINQLMSTMRLAPEERLRVAWGIIADIEPEIYNKYRSVPVELDPHITDACADTNVDETLWEKKPVKIRVSLPWMEGRLDRAKPKTALYVAMVLRHEIQHVIDTEGATNIFKKWWALHKIFFGGEERAFDKERELLEKYVKKYNLKIDRSLYPVYNILIDSQYHLGYFWTKISIVLVDVFVLCAVFWGIWRVFLRKRFGDKFRQIIERLMDRLEGRGGDDNGYIQQGEESRKEFESKRQEIEKNDITGQYKDRLLRVIGQVGVQEEVRGRIETIRIYGFTSIVKGKDDFFLGYYDTNENKLFLATDLINGLEIRGPPSLVDEYLLHEVICPVLGHYEAIKEQREIFSGHYIEKPDKGLLGEVLRWWIDRNKVARDIQEAIRRIRARSKAKWAQYPEPVILFGGIADGSSMKDVMDIDISIPLPDSGMSRSRKRFREALHEELIAIDPIYSSKIFYAESIGFSGFLNHKINGGEYEGQRYLVVITTDEVQVINLKEIKTDVVISSEGTKKGHTEYHRQGRFKEVIRQIAEELGLEADRDGRYDLRKAGSQIRTSYGELRIESDGILVIIDSRFRKDHAGRRQMAVYARNEVKARHELAELRAWIGYAKKGLGMTDKGIRDGRLNRWMQDKRNFRKVRKLHRKFHKEGMKAEKGTVAGELARDEIVERATANLEKIIKSRKDIRDILNFIAPYKVRFIVNSPRSVRVTKEDNEYILELDLSSFSDEANLAVSKRLLRVELWRITAAVVLETIETPLQKDTLIDVILILLDAQDINRRYRYGNRKVIAKKSRKAYLERLRHEKGRRYVTLIKRLSHTPNLEEKVRLIYLYLNGEEKADEVLKLQNFFTQNRGILIRIKIAYSNIEKKVRIVKDHLRVVDRRNDVPSIPDHAPSIVEDEDKDKDKEDGAAKKGRDKKVTYEYTTPNRGEEYYLQKIRELLPLLENPDEGVRLRIFLGQIFSWYLVARADHADTKALRELITGALHKAVLSYDQGFSLNIQALMITKNKNRIMGLARKLRNNPYLLGYKIYLGVDLGSALEGESNVDVLYAVVYEIKEVRQFKVYNRYKQDGEDLPIYYLGYRIDGLDKEMSAFGFTYRGDIFGAVLRDKISHYLVGGLLPILRGRPLTHSIAKAVKRDIEGVPKIYKIVEDITVIHELQHTVDELLKPNIDSVSTETSAYLASIALSECPYIALVKVIELYIDPFIPLFSPSHSKAAERIMQRLMEKLGMRKLADRKDTANMVLDLALRLEDGMLANFAREIHGELFGHDALVGLEPVAPVIARHKVPKQSSTHEGLSQRPKLLWSMLLSVFTIIGLSILFLVSYLSLEPVRPKAEEKPTPPVVSSPVREEPRPRPESFSHTVKPKIPDDCLWHIARKYYAVSSRRIERYIAEYNNKNNPDYKIKDIDVIIDGRRIILPYRIVHKVRGKNVRLKDVARMYNVSEGYLRAMNPKIKLDGKLQKGDEIEVAARINSVSDNIGKGVEFMVTAANAPGMPGDTISAVLARGSMPRASVDPKDRTLTDVGLTIITKYGRDDVSVSPAEINTSNIKDKAIGLNVYKEFGQDFIGIVDGIKVMVYEGTAQSRSAGAFAHMGDNGVLYIDSVLLNNDMAIIHEVIHEYLKRFKLEELIAKIDKTELEEKIKKKAGGNPALLRHYYARYYLQDSINGTRPENEELTYQIRLNAVANKLGISVSDLNKLLADLGGDDVRLSLEFLKLIKEDGEISEEEIQVLVNNIELVMTVIDNLAGIVKDSKKQEIIKRIALFLSIEHIKRSNIEETIPLCMRELVDKLPIKDNARPRALEILNGLRNKDVHIADMFLKKIAEEFGVDVLDVRKYLYLRIEVAKIAKDNVDLVVRYLFGEDIDNKIKDSVKRIVLIKQLDRIMDSLDIPLLEASSIEIFRQNLEEVDIGNKLILQHLSIYISNNPDWDRENINIDIIKRLVDKKQLRFVYDNEAQKEAFINLLKEKIAPASWDLDWEGKLVFINASELDLSKEGLVYVVKTKDSCPEAINSDNKVIVTGDIVDISLMWKVILRDEDKISGISSSGIWIILPKVKPFIKDYYDALNDARELINQSA